MCKRCWYCPHYRLCHYQGGGGGSQGSGQIAQGGPGGGGAGNASGVGVSGLANTGGGGGGGTASGSGAGGSGLAIVRYLGTTRKGTGGVVTNDGTYTYHTFTSTGANTFTA